MSFTIAGAAPHPPVAPDDFPNFLQIRVNGVNLGGPDVLVLDFVGDGWNITRGEGDQANVVTIRWEG